MSNKKTIKKSRLRKILKTLYVLTGLSTIYKAIEISLAFISNKVAKSSDKTGENEVGYDNIKELRNVSVHTNNFVILHVNKKDNIEI